jgi:hypothetical protein
MGRANRERLMQRIALVIALLLGAALPAYAADPETNK